MLERWFELTRNRTTVAGEVRGGLTTFMVMAYIIFVNPAILSFAGALTLLDNTGSEVLFGTPQFIIGLLPVFDIGT